MIPRSSVPWEPPLIEPDNFKWAYSLLQESARHCPKDVEVLYDFAWAAYSMEK